MKMYILSISVLLFCLFTACQSTKTTANTNNKKITKKTATLDSAALKAHNIGYAYGVVVSQQVFPSEGLVMTEAEKDINEFVAGFQKGMEGDQDIATQANHVLQKRFGEKIPSATPEEAKQVAYQLGVNVISGLSTQVAIDKDAVNLEAMKSGFKEAEAGKSKMDTVAIDSILTAFFEVYKPELEAKQKIQEEEMLQQQQAEAIPNIEAGKAFSAENAEKEGVVTLASGLQYKIIREGTGKQPTIDDRVKTHYHGTTIDGKVFDSSVERGEPATFGVRQVIQGWQEGIPLMKEGAKYILYIPQELAYGMQSPSADIPAGSTLIFEVELIEVNPKQ